MRVPTVQAGYAVMRVPCPSCGHVAVIPFSADARLVLDAETSILRLRFKHKPVEHTCRQTTIDDHLPAEDEHPRLFDAREAAAGGPGLD